MPQSHLTFVRRWLAPLFALVFASVSFGAPRITEFMASNDSGRVDADRDYSDWIEIHNPDAAAVSLDGYFLTDNGANLDKWRFPAVTVPPDGYLVVFASGKDRTDPAGELHTDFSLSAAGEYLALVAPDGKTVLSAFAPTYPPQFEDVSFGIGQPGSTWSFFNTPTPGAVNGTGTRAGPIIQMVQENPPQPDGGPLKIEAMVRAANDPVASVQLYYRQMFGVESMLPMTDDGTGGDLQAGDGIWTADIPAAAFAPGEMTRWRVVGRDTSGTQTKEPAYRATTDSHQYFGTVTRDARIQTLLPVVHWFTSSPNGSGTSSGARGAIYYDGEFYDNVHFSLHGQSSSVFPKKSYNIDFNKTQRFRWKTNEAPVADIDLLTNWADKSKVRHVLGYEVMREAGVAAHFAFTVRVQQNGRFFSTADLVEDPDETYLERAGLNPEGALYKMYQNTLNRDAGNSATSGVEKKTRKFEGNSDLQALINGLDLTGTALETYLYDNIDIPACVNMLAANSVIRNIDMHQKNWYIYRDTGRSDEWAILPWDLDLSHGRVWNSQNTYFDNNIYTDGYVVTGTAIRLVSHLFANSAIRSMIMRRIRTLSDRFLQPPPGPGTPESELYYERRLNEQLALLDPPSIVPSDARQDFEKWGSWLHGGDEVAYTSSNPAVETMAEAIGRFKNEYLPGRRNFIYNRQVVGKGGEIPFPQTGGPTFQYTQLLQAGAPAKALVPVNNDLGFSWIGLSSVEPLDTSGWQSGTTGVGYERGSGYESLIGLNVDQSMRSNNSVYIRMEFDVPDPAVFDRLELRMKYDDGFVAFLNGTVLVATNSPSSLQWNSAATALHEASAAEFVVFDVTSKKLNFRPGRNILAIQGLNDSVSSSDMIIVPELWGGSVRTDTNPEHPPIDFGRVEFNPSSGNQDEEYIELKNANAIAVDISDWSLTGAVEHKFPGGTVIPANGTLYVSPNAAAFRARAISPRGGERLLVQDAYTGHLSNLGETIVLLDDSGATNNVISYQGDPSDAQRYLVVSEVMYHPPGDLGEFVEILNISSNVIVDLANVRFTEGIVFNFSGSAVRTLAPGGRALVVRDLAAFTALHGSNLPVAGVFTNSALSNGGELIKLEDAENGTIREFTYGDAAPWPASADGGGYSLVLRQPYDNPDHALPANWQSSVQPGGSPGSGDGGSFPANPLGDANGNGESDLIDYALGNDLGLEPLAPFFSVSSEPASEGTVTLNCPVSLAADQAIVEFEFSTDLLEWQAGATYLEPQTTEPLGDGRAWLRWRVKAPLAGGEELFMRLRVTAR